MEFGLFLRVIFTYIAHYLHDTSGYGTYSKNGLSEDQCSTWFSILGLFLLEERELHQNTLHLSIAYTISPTTQFNPGLAVDQWKIHDKQPFDDYRSASHWINSLKFSKLCVNNTNGLWRTCLGTSADTLPVWLFSTWHALTNESRPWWMCIIQYYMWFGKMEGRLVHPLVFYFE